MFEYKILTYYSDLVDIPLPLVDMLEKDKLNYTIIPNDMCLEEIENILKNHFSGKHIIFFIPEVLLDKIKTIPTLSVEHAHYFVDEDVNIIGFLYPKALCLSDASLNKLGNIIYDAMQISTLWSNKWKQDVRSLA